MSKVKFLLETNNAGKISKKEKRGRRNQRLRKILQPKNALMVLNELVGGQKYTIVEGTVGIEHTENFAATVVVDGQEYIGFGKFIILRAFSHLYGKV